MEGYINQHRYIGKRDHGKRTRINHQIFAREVRLIGPDGEQVGVVSLSEALQQAENAGLDLVEIAPNVAPPVCRVMDYGKYLFEQKKKSKQKSKSQQTKELKMRPTTDIGDYQVKIKQAMEFLQAGDKVKFTIKFRGREMSYQEQGKEKLTQIIKDLGEVGIVEQMPKLEGKQLGMLVVPKKGQKGN